MVHLIFNTGLIRPRKQLSSNRFSSNLFRLVALLAVLCTTARSQTISYQAEEKPLAEVLDDLAANHHLLFSYPAEMVASKKVTIDADDVEMSDFLDQLLAPFDLKAFPSDENYYYIRLIKRRIQVIVTSEETNEPMAYATVSSTATKRGSISTSEGRAVLIVNPTVDTSLSVHFVGYEELEIPLKDHPEDTIQVALNYDPVALNQVVVEYHNQAITLEEASLVKLRPDEMKVLPGLA